MVKGYQGTDEHERVLASSCTNNPWQRHLLVHIPEEHAGRVLLSPQAASSCTDQMQTAEGPPTPSPTVIRVDISNVPPFPPASHQPDTKQCKPLGWMRCAVCRVALPLPTHGTHGNEGQGAHP